MPRKKVQPAKNAAAVTNQQNIEAGPSNQSVTVTTAPETRRIPTEREIRKNILPTDLDEVISSVNNNTKKANVSKNRQRKQQIPTRKNAAERQRINVKRMPPLEREMLELQNTTRALIPKLPFSRLIRECLQNCSKSADLRITADSLLALQESSELYLVHLFEDSYRCTLHRQRVTLQPNDMRLVLLLRGTSISKEN